MEDEIDCTYLNDTVCEIMRERFGSDLPRSQDSTPQDVYHITQADTSTINAGSGRDVVAVTGVGTYTIRLDPTELTYNISDETREAQESARSADHVIIHYEAGQETTIRDLGAEDRLTIHFGGQDITGLTPEQALHRANVTLTDRSDFSNGEIAARHLQISGDTNHGEAVITIREHPTGWGLAGILERDRREHAANGCLEKRDETLATLNDEFYSARDEAVTSHLGLMSEGYDTVRAAANDTINQMISQLQTNIEITHDDAAQCVMDARANEYAHGR